jgi:hypothetical protein
MQYSTIVEILKCECRAFCVAFILPPYYALRVSKIDVLSHVYSLCEIRAPGLPH